MHRVSGMCCADLPTQRPTRLLRCIHLPVRLPSCVTPSLIYYWLGSRAPPIRPKASQLHPLSIYQVRYGRSFAGTGISTRCPSTTPVGLALGPDLPWAEQPGPGTLGHPAAEILTLLSLLMPAFSLPHPPQLDHSVASRNGGRSPTQPCGCRGFG